MKKLLLIALFLLLSWPAEAQSRTGRYTSYDGVLQVEYPRGWRIGTVDPDMERIIVSRQPIVYELTLFHSQPDAEIRFKVRDFGLIEYNEEELIELYITSVEEYYPDISFTNFQLGEFNAFEMNISESNAESRRIVTRVEETSRVIYYFGRNNSIIEAVLIGEDENLYQDFTTITESLTLRSESNRLKRMKRIEGCSQSLQVQA